MGGVIRPFIERRLEPGVRADAARRVRAESGSLRARWSAHLPTRADRSRPLQKNNNSVTSRRAALLHPVPGAIDEMGSQQARAHVLLHVLQRPWPLKRSQSLVPAMKREGPSSFGA